MIVNKYCIDTERGLLVMKTTIPATVIKEEIKITIVSKDFKVTETIRNKVEEKVSTLDKFSKKNKQARVKLENIKGTFIVTIIMKLKGKVLKTIASSEDLHKSIDLATENMKNQMSKLPKIPKKKQKNFKSIRTLKAPIKKNKDKRVYSKQRFLNDDSLKPMFKTEAEMQMKLNGLKTFHYIDAETFKPSKIRAKKAV